MNPEDQLQEAETLPGKSVDSDPGRNHMSEDRYDLSPTQLGMLIHSSDRASGAYIQQMLCSLREELNLAALEEAWQEIVNRHPVFRTSFHIVASPPFQRVHPRIQLVITKEDWCGMTSQSQEMALTSYLAADRQRGFEHTGAPLIRIALFRMAQARYEMVWTSHHALMDGRSRRLVLGELFSLYDAYCEGTSLELPQPRPYSDYINWLKDYDLLAAEAFWRRELRGFGAPTLVDLGGGRAPKDGGPVSHATGEAYLSETTTTAMRQFAEHAGVTLNTLVQGSWSLLVSRYTGEEDIVFGATRACRRSTIADAESMVGLFINTVPVRVRVSSEELVLPWLQSLRASQVAVRQYEHTPLTKIQEWCEIPRGTSLFESLVVFENYQLDQALGSQGGKWKHRRFRLFEQTNYPLVLSAFGGKELLLKLEYDETRFDHSAIERMLGHLTTLLQGMVDSPQLRIGDLPLLKETERRQLLIEWQGSRTESPRDSCIHELFEQQAERTPDATALLFENRELSYGELNRRANQLAHYLRSQGVGPETLVAICLERSLEMVIALLGVLKAGGAYVPLDSDYPRERLSLMLSDMRATVLLTAIELMDRLPDEPDRCAQVICVDAMGERIAQESEENPRSNLAADNLAYVIYTSGSTGKPKGVQITHGNVVRLFKQTEPWFGFDERDVWTLFHSCAFDFSVWELWGALNYGGRLVIVPYYISRSPDEFYDLLRQQQVTVLNQTPSAFRQLIQAEEAGKSSAGLRLRLVIFGGEALDIQSLRPWFERHGDERPRLVNMYGITETTVHVTYRPLAITDLNSAAASVIGGPISDLKAYVLDRRRRIVPVGVPGELYVGGGGVARGYLNRPELTAERFIPNPFSDRPGGRLYRTGDLGRYRANGDLEYLGRVDTQVKVRGFRIELGEIEVALSQHPAVRECVVISREDLPDDKRLIAYVVLKPRREPGYDRASDADRKHMRAPPSSTFPSDDLRRFLKEKLPEYMVPAAFVELESIPLTNNGKIDRRALPDPDRSRLDSQETFVAPRTAVEQKLAEIWGSLLRLAQVGVRDNFFELGGHSLLATKVVARVRDAFQIELPLRSLFESPTVEGLAEFVGEAKKEARGTMPAIRALPRQRRPPQAP